MSQETIEWLNANTMLGNTSAKEIWTGNSWMIAQADGSFKAWWQNADFTNAYDGPIPVEEVERVLFNWEPLETQVMHKKPCAADEADGTDGNGNPFLWVPDMGRKGIMHPTNNTIFGYFGIDTYSVHSYKQWLINYVHNIVDGEIGIDSAGLLRQGGVAYVGMSLPDDITSDRAKFAHRPNIIASTSIDGTKTSTYTISELIPCCDNSLHFGENAGASAKVKIKHSRKSLGRISEIRDALGIVYQTGEKFSQFVDMLSDVDVTDTQFRQIIAQLVPIPEAKVELTSKGVTTVNQRAVTIADSKQAELWNMWTSDHRAAPWNGTLLGAYQAVNTWNEHFRSNNDNQVERQMTGLLSGSYAKEDGKFWTLVERLELADMNALMAVMS